MGRSINDKGDGTDEYWNHNISDLVNITEKVHQELNTSFVFGACHCGNLVQAPKYVIPILILPDINVYKRRFKKRNPNDIQDYKESHKECQILAKKIAEKKVKYKNILVLHQPIDECIDVTIYRICELIINKMD